jgi:nucleoside-diphosphate-sugar epimerase
MKSISIVGLGWLGNACADYFLCKNYAIKATKTSLSHLEQFPIYAYKLGEEFPKEAVSDIVIICIASRNSLLEHFEKLFFDLKKLGAKKIILMSSTSVYQQVHGECKETDHLTVQELGNMQLSIANSLINMFPNSVLLRLAGLVGPNRHPAKFLAGKKNVGNPDQFVNLVHQQDIIHIIEECIEQDFIGVLNVCSSIHYTRKEFYTKVCEKAKLIVPEFTEGNTEPIRFVSNEKSKRILKYTYIYDDLLAYYLSSDSRA